jgi:hypothetical protein
MLARTQRTREAKPCSSSAAPTGSAGVPSSKRNTTMTRVALNCHHPDGATVGPQAVAITPGLVGQPGVHRSTADPLAVKMRGFPHGGPLQLGRWLR